MSDPIPANAYAVRWDALLAENGALQKEHLDLLSSLTPPFSQQDKVRLDASRTRIQQLNHKLHTLVDDWSADARVK
jgi:hypothetical protein